MQYQKSQIQQLFLIPVKQMLTFDEIDTPYIDAQCSHCNVVTVFSGKKRYRLTDEILPLLIPEFQCQDCGKLIFSLPDDPNNTTVLLKHCACNGQFRKDKPLFCPVCRFNKTRKI